LVLFIHGVADLALERLAMERKADLFENIFGLRVRLEEAPLSVPPGKAKHSKAPAGPRGAAK